MYQMTLRLTLLRCGRAGVLFGGFLGLFLAGAAASPASAAVVYVSPEGNDANSGATWALAKATVQAAVDSAAPGDQVWVAAGTYVENLLLSDGVELYGGFAGTETLLSERDWATNVTILDGNSAGRVIMGGDTRIDGFTIRNGQAALGAGILVSAGTPVITNNTITGNSATSGGGGIYCDGCTPTITNNTITTNTVSSPGIGGGIYCFNSSPTIRNNTIAGNSSGGHGGGIAIDHGDPSLTMVASNTVTGNSSSIGGGIYCENNDALIVNNTVIGNSVTTAIGILNSGIGGGIFTEQCSVTVADNKICGNSAANAGGGISCFTGSPIVTGNTIASNMAPFGGGIHCQTFGTPVVANTIVAFNSSGFYQGADGGFTLRYNCVFGNTAYNYSGVSGLPDPTGTDGNISADPLFAVASAGADMIWGTTDDTFANLHLLPGSPCLDAGNNADVPADGADLDGDSNTAEPLPIDLAGAQRFGDDLLAPNTGAGTPPIVDIGAYEQHYGDLNGDGVINSLDNHIFVAARPSVVGDPNYNPDCDFNFDGRVDGVDLHYFHDYYGIPSGPKKE